MTRRLCACGCGRFALPNRRWASRHSPGGCPDCGRESLSGRTLDTCPCRDERAIAYYAGRAEGRWRRPPRHRPTDTSLIAVTYRRGYYTGLAEPASPDPQAQAVAS